MVKSYKVTGVDPKGKKHILTIRAPNEAAARQAAADILMGRENVKKVERK